MDEKLDFEIRKDHVQSPSFHLYFEWSMTEFLSTAKIAKKIFNEIIVFFASFAVNLKVQIMPA